MDFPCWRSFHNRLLFYCYFCFQQFSPSVHSTHLAKFHLTHSTALHIFGVLITMGDFLTVQKMKPSLLSQAQRPSSNSSPSFPALSPITELLLKPNHTTYYSTQENNNCPIALLQTMLLTVFIMTAHSRSCLLSV